MLSRRDFTSTVLACLGAPRAVAAPRLRDHYEGDLLLKALPGRLMEIQSRFVYVDPLGRRWSVPPGGIVDGASIPRVFWTFLGGPWDGAYRDAAVVHDWYCAVRVQPWRDTHDMFYHAMRCSGVPESQARTMYLAVYYAGPSWDDLTIANMRKATKQGETRPPNSPARSRERFQFDTTIAFADPTTPEQANFINAYDGAPAEADRLVNELRRMAEEANRKGLDLKAMRAMVDSKGRAEVNAENVAYFGSLKWGGEQ